MDFSNDHLCNYLLTDMPSFIKIHVAGALNISTENELSVFYTKICQDDMLEE